MTTASSSTLDCASAPVPAPARCRHCGDPCAAEGLSTSAGTFCCTGCASVFALLQEHGLTQFYACEPNAGLSQRLAAQRDRGRFAALDDPAIGARFIDAEDGVFSHATFSVPSLHCASCLWLLEQLWRFVEGIAVAKPTWCGARCGCRSGPIARRCGPWRSGWPPSVTNR